MAIMDDKITWIELNMPFRVKVHSRTSVVEATFIPTAFNEYSENFRNSGATNKRTTILVTAHTTTLRIIASRNAAVMDFTVHLLS